MATRKKAKGPTGAERAAARKLCAWTHRLGDALEQVLRVQVEIDGTAGRITVFTEGDEAIDLTVNPGRLIPLHKAEVL